MAVLPSLFLLAYFVHLDKARPEPRGEILRAFFLGVFSTLPAIILEFTAEIFLRPWIISPLVYAMAEAFLVAALCEEGTKLFIVRSFIYKRADFDEVMDGIVYTVAAGLGFACMENLLYVASGGMTVALVRAFTAVPLHTICSVLLGYSIGMARFVPTASEEQSLMFRGLAAAVLMHGVYDFFLFAAPVLGGLSAFMVFPLLFAGIFMVRRRVRRALAFDVR